MDLRSMFPAITLCGGQITGDSLLQNGHNPGKNPYLCTVKKIA
jgi:hypothetical protein